MISTLIRPVIGDPESLRGVAARLDAGAAFLDEVARDVGRSVDLVSGGWSGSAEVAYAAHTLQLSRSIGELMGQLGAVSSATRWYATALESAQAVVAGLAREADALSATAVAPNGGPAVSMAGSTGGSIAGLVDRAESAHLENLQRARELSLVLDGSDPERALPAAVAEIVDQVGAWKSVGAALSAGSVAWGASRYWVNRATLVSRSTLVARSVGEVGAAVSTPPPMTRAAAAAGRRMAENVAAARAASLPPVAKVLPVGFLRVAGPLATMAEGAVDLAQGDPDHGGWRDAATRVMGGVGAVGGAGLLLATGPVGTGVAVAAVAAYGLWKAGTAVYDNWPALSRGLQQGGRLAGRATAAAGDWVTGKAAEAGEAVVDLVATVTRTLPTPPATPGVGAGVY